MAFCEAKKTAISYSAFALSAPDKICHLPFPPAACALNKPSSCFALNKRGRREVVLSVHLVHCVCSE